MTASEERPCASGRFEGGRFVISLDFELHWGVGDLLSVDEYRENLLGVRKAIPRILQLFERYGIRATWATVGMLLARTKQELLRACPSERPTYTDENSSNYSRLDSVGEDEMSDPFHFGHTLAAAVVRTPGQELATHTFSHYFCLEPGQRIDQFASDLRASIAIARQALGVEVRSIVFPRNQFTDAHVGVCAELGIRTFRGTPQHWLYRPAPHAADRSAHRIGRLVDAYVPVCRDTVARPRRVGDGGIVDVPASRFLRPVTPFLAALDGLRAHRVRHEMEEAARTCGVYHLWWHPHNFGADVDRNAEFLEGILRHYRDLHRRRGMLSVSMIDIADELAA